MLWLPDRRLYYPNPVPGVVASQGAAAAAPPALTEVSSAKTLRTTGADPWDDTVNIVAGNNRVLLVMFASESSDLASVVLDPTGDAIALTAMTGTPQSFGTEFFFAYRLLEAAFPGTTGNKTLRIDWSSPAGGAVRIILLENASQTLFSAGANHDANTALTITVTHPTDTFAAGSFVYSGCYAEDNGSPYTVAGDVTEVDDDQLATITDSWIFAKGTLGGAQATASGIFTRTNAGTVRKQGITAVVEPVA